MKSTKEFVFTFDELVIIRDALEDAHFECKCLIDNGNQSSVMKKTQARRRALRDNFKEACRLHRDRV